MPRPTGYPGGLGHIVENELVCALFSFIEIQFVGHLITRKIHIGQAVIIQVANGHATPVVGVFILHHVLIGRFSNGIGKRDVGIVGIEGRK